MKQLGQVLLGLGAVLLAIGLSWIVVYYASAAQLPIAALGNWNILIGAVPAFGGFALVVVGLVLTLSARKR